MSENKKVDVVVVGGGITGAAILRELSKYDLKSVLVDKEPDIAAGTTKANSAILHAGFDAAPGSMKSKMNVAGNKLYHELQAELDLDIEWTGSLVVATNEEEMETVKGLLTRGRENGVEGLALWSADEVLAAEPNLSKDVKGALWAPSAGVCWPFGLAIAFAENAVENGAEVLRNCQVEGFEKADGKICAVKTNQGVIETKYVINAAGLYADAISRLAGDDSFKILPRKGEYVLFDKTAREQMVKGVIFPTPSKTSKGILVCTTTHGNTFVGPNAQDQADDKENTAVTPQGMAEIINSARKLLPNIPVGAAITEFGGLRAVSSTGDFVIGKSTVGGLLQAAGIQSPGLTSAPAIAKYIVDLLVAEEKNVAKKADFKTRRAAQPIFHRLAHAQQAELIKENKLYGRVICRCETITEAEIINAIHRPCGARTVDGVKRRTRAGMGRCQGGFCGPRVTQILARELGIPITEVVKEHADSHLFYEKTQTNGADVQ